MTNRSLGMILHLHDLHDLQGLARACKGLQGLARACKGLQGLARACKGLQGLARACKGLQGLARGLREGRDSRKIQGRFRKGPSGPCRTEKAKLHPEAPQVC